MREKVVKVTDAPVQCEFYKNILHHSAVSKNNSDMHRNWLKMQTYVVKYYFDAVKTLFTKQTNKQASPNCSDYGE